MNVEMPKPKRACVIELLPRGYKVYADKQYRDVLGNITGVRVSYTFDSMDFCIIDISPRYDVDEVLETIRQVCNGAEIPAK